MNVQYRKRFLKELAKIPSGTRLKIEQFVFHTLPQANTFNESGAIEKMQGYSSFYKIRFGSYRVGIRFEDNVCTLERVLHRKEIYRFFP